MTTAKKILSTILSFIILAIVCLAIFIKNLMVGIVLAIIEATKKSIREAEDFFLKKKTPTSEVVDAETEPVTTATTE